MLNEEKIRIMTRAAIYENGKGKEDIKINTYGGSDYVRFNILKTLIGVTVGVVLIFGLYAVYNMDYFMANMMKLDLLKLGRTLLVIYLIILAVYTAVSIIVYQRRYAAAGKRLKFYNEELEMIEEIAEDDLQNNENAGRTNG